MCEKWLAAEEWQLEVVDVFTDPMRAVEDKVLVTPTLLKLTPPVVRIVGDLSQRETVLAALDLTGREG
jgi:circadian clock protein KaiB